MSLRIDYLCEAFPNGSPVTNGYGVLETNWRELLWAAVTVGRPSHFFVFRYGGPSRYEALFRWSLVRMSLEQRGLSAPQLFRTDAAKNLDPTEKGAVNYFLGMVICKLFCARILNAPWAMHLDVYGPPLNPVLKGRSRPDLIAETNSHDWVALESKGRSVPTNDDTKDKAKEQAEGLVSINGVAPIFNIGCITYFRSDVLHFFWRDPKIDKDNPPKEIKLTHNDSVWRYYYQPVLDLIRSHDLYFKEMLRETVLMPIKELDLEVGIHPLILEPLSQDKWGDAKRLCHKDATVFEEPGYQQDGIRIAAGSTWFSPFTEFGGSQQNTLGR